MEDILKDSDMAGLFESVTEITKAKSYKIRVDFSNRFRVWKMQILPGRMNEIQQEGTIEFIHRAMDLLFSNGHTLTNRAIREGGPEMLMRIKCIDDTLKSEMAAYLAEIDRLKLLNIDKEE